MSLSGIRKNLRIAENNKVKSFVNIIDQDRNSNLVNKDFMVFINNTIITI